MIELKTTFSKNINIETLWIECFNKKVLGEMEFG